MELIQQIFMILCIFINPFSNSNSTFTALNLCQKADFKAHHTNTLFNIHKPQALQGSAQQKKQEGIGNLGWICFSKEV